MPRSLGRLIPPRHLLLSLASGLLVAFSFPPFNLTFLIWFSLVPLLLIRAQTIKGAFGFGFLSGVVANGIIFFWIWKTFEAAGVGFVTTFNAWILLSLVLALYLGVFNVINFKLSSNVWSPWLLGAVWVCLEHIRSITFTGFPWALFSHTQVNTLPFLQLASFTGAPGLTFFIVAINGVLVSLIKNKYRLKPAQAALPILLFLIFLGGWSRILKPEKNETKPVYLALLQGNINQYEKWNSAHELKIRKQYESLISSLPPVFPYLVIWPESAVPGWIPNDRFYMNWLKRLVQKSGKAHLVGAVSQRKSKDFNSALLFNKQGMIETIYDKQHLVPFGEYVPLGGLLKRVVPFLGSLGEFKAGEKTRLFNQQGSNFSVSICYEGIFPDLIRHAVNRGSEFLVNITNDGWYLDTGAPEQHYNAYVLRAVENARPVVRVANTGISGIIDAYGRQWGRSSLMDTTVITHALFLPREKPQTVYTLWGNWFTYLCWAMVFLAFFVYFKHVPRTSRKNKKSV